MKKEQKENYRDYIIRHLLPQFNGRSTFELLQFLDFAKEVALHTSFVSRNGRENPNPVIHIMEYNKITSKE